MTLGDRRFAQLRRDDPVHYCGASSFGPYWSITRHDDIFAVELDHVNFSSSSELGGIQVADTRASAPPAFDLISMLAHAEATRNMPPREFIGTRGCVGDRLRSNSCGFSGKRFCNGIFVSRLLVRRSGSIRISSAVSVPCRCGSFPSSRHFLMRLPHSPTIRLERNLQQIDPEIYLTRF
ncbi:MAG TPA: hypothetical protein VGL53_07380 [Bryobacteraceae bacterium]